MSTHTHSERCIYKDISLRRKEYVTDNTLIINLWVVDIDIISEGYIDPTIQPKNSDIVIICVYPNLTSKFIKENMNSFKS